MTGFSDADLREALEPLAGDPAADWARVLAELPETGPAARPLWPWIAAASAAGLLIGWGAATLARRESPPTTTEPTTQVAVTPPAGGESALLIGGMGGLVVETDDGPRKAGPGHTVALEQFVRTADKGSAILLLPGKVELRLAEATRVALLGRRSMELAQGRLFVRVPAESGPVSVAAVEGEVVVEPGGAVQLTSSDGMTEVVSLEGTAVFTNLAGEPTRLEALHRIACADGLMTDVTEIDLVFDEVAWQIEMLAGCPDRGDEAHKWVWTLVDALGSPKTAARAEHALRRSSGIAAQVLGMAAYELPDSQATLRKRCWMLLSEIGNASSLSYLLIAPKDEDPDIRVAAVAAVERITGIPSGRDLEFWKSAPPSRRFDVLEAWREKLRDF